MTCCLALIDSGATWVAADSAGVSGLSVEVRRDPKLFRSGPYLIAFTSSFRMGQLLRFANLPRPSEADPFEFMVREFVPAVRDALSGGGFRRKRDDVESGGTFIVTWDRHVFSVMDDFQVAHMRAPYTAVGCGWELAIGALGATEDLGLPPRERVLRAMVQAERFSAGVRRPFRLAFNSHRGTDR